MVPGFRSARRRSRWVPSARAMVLIATTVAALLTASCRTETPSTPLERPPLLFRSSVPADSTEGYYEPEGIDLSIRFRRELEEGDLATVQLVPRPLSSGPLVKGHNDGRELFWPDVVLDPTVNTYRWLVDGPDMPEAVLIRFHPATPLQATGRILGELIVGAPWEDASGALVYALYRGQRAYTVASDSLLGAPIVSITMVAPGDVGREGQPYVVRDLPLGEPHLIVAVLDTDGDGRYEIDQDWWGYARDLFGTPQDAPAVGPFNDTEPPVDLELVPPGVLDPDRF